MNPTKSGFLTSEFIGKILAILVGALYASGKITEDHVTQAVAINAALLGAVGYTIGRTALKVAAIKSAGIAVEPADECPPAPTSAADQTATTRIVGAASSSAGILIALVLSLSILGGTGCATVRPALAAGASAVLDCESGPLEAVARDGYRVGAAQVPAWISGDGAVDTIQLRASLSALVTAQARCFQAGVVAAVLAATAAPSKGAARAAALSVDTPALRAAVAEVRAGWGLSSVRVAGLVL